MVDVTKKENSTVEVHIYDVPNRNAGMIQVDGDAIDVDILVEVVVGRLESEFVFGQKFMKSAKDIGVSSGSQDDNLTDMSSLKDAHESDNLLQKKNSLSPENSDLLEGFPYFKYEINARGCKLVVAK